jgi:kynurenine 3-monooxygenase
MGGQSVNTKNITIAGAGLAGALLATLLAKRGWKVDVFERRGDPRVHGYEGGRSINLALAERGMHALRSAGLADVVLQQAVMMRGRMVHSKTGESQLQRYGKDDSEVIYSVHRGRLNISLLDAAEAAGAKIYFNQRLTTIDFDLQQCQFFDEIGKQQHTHSFDLLVGADGAGSAVREAMSDVVELNQRFEPLGHSYKELEIPPGSSDEFLIDNNALHIWPRGGYMCIALPNTEKTFTVTLFLPNEGQPSFASLPDVNAARDFFQNEFPSALRLIPEFDQDWQHNPTSGLATLYIDQWHYQDKAILLGDAAHAMVPFHGQGMNCAFEDCVALDQHLNSALNLQEALSNFENQRKPNARAIQQMALDNYLEMRDYVDDPAFILQRQLERVLAERHPGVFVPRYSMVTFMRVPYSIAYERGKIQRQILQECTQGCTDIAQVELAQADRLVRERLSLLDA